MRTLTLLAALVLGASLAGAQSIAWKRDAEAAQAEAKRTGKLIFIDFFADWCGPCKMLDKETWPDPAVVKEMRAYVPLKLDTDRGGQELARAKRVTAMPTLMVLDEDLNEIMRISSFLPAQQAAQFLKGIAGDHKRLSQMRPASRRGARAKLRELAALEAQIGSAPEAHRTFALAYARGEADEAMSQTMVEAALRFFEGGDIASGVSILRLASLCRVSGAQRARLRLAEAGGRADLGQTKEALAMAQALVNSVKAEPDIRQRAQDLVADLS
jgi:thiol-disulfide isomerase/thioredoxin